MSSEFINPLRISEKTEFKKIDFGIPTENNDILALQDLLYGEILQTIAYLPSDFAEETKKILEVYSGKRRNFIGLFYAPIWSFLHWIPKTYPNRISNDILILCRRAHSLSLLLHLWDDHLCDGQLNLDILRLQFRTILWNLFADSIQEICKLLSLDPSVAEKHLFDYLSSIQYQKISANINEYSEEFIKQIGIWTVVPRLMGYSAGKNSVSKSLIEYAENFGIAWRLLDDLQDIDLDLRSDKKSAIWILLNESGREFWNDCRILSQKQNSLNEKSWEKLQTHILETNIVSSLLDSIGHRINLCMELAQKNEWFEMAAEIRDIGTLKKPFGF